MQSARLPARIEAPTALSAFAHDIMPAPRSWVEAFVNVAEFTEHESGGHFAAWERPQDYADDVRPCRGADVGISGAVIDDERRTNAFGLLVSLNKRRVSAWEQ